ncbi:MAG: serine/threonine protein kinase [Rhodothermales bacterium]|jgi:serine/threonine protein kinase
MIGSVVAQFEITHRIGEGGMGVVYKAQDTKLGRTVALKFLTRLGTDEETHARFLAEARTAAALDHPGICPIYEFGEHEDQAFIVMASVEGQTLAERIKDGDVPVADAVDWVRQAAEAIGAAHDQGIVHRDIKPGNLIVDPRGRLRVLDFGLARFLGSAHMTTAGGTVGTAAYMSPEQARGETVDHRSDIWGLGRRTGTD